MRKVPSVRLNRRLCEVGKNVCAHSRWRRLKIETLQKAARGSTLSDGKCNNKAREVIALVGAQVDGNSFPGPGASAPVQYVPTPTFLIYGRKDQFLLPSLDIFLFNLVVGNKVK